MKQQLTWTVGHMADKNGEPAQFVPAGVPGNANLDWAVAADMPDWKRETNFKNFKWMEDCYWLYRTRLPEFRLEDGQQAFFVCGGIDYIYEIYLNKKLLLAHEGMFTPFELELDAQAAGGELEVLIFPIPKDTLGEPDCRQEAAQCCKPAVSYEWDWHPRLVPSGIWEEAFFEIREPERIVSAGAEYCLESDFSRAEVSICAEAVGGGMLEYRLFAPDGTQMNPDIHQSVFALDHPALWWCNGYGQPNLYTWQVRLVRDGCEKDCRTGRIGIRELKLVMNEGGWDGPFEFPKGRSVAPITLELNGVPVFAKGSNWVNPEVFSGTITRQTYEPLVKLAKDANFNIFRSWGGGIINKESFFDLCDENGIMVWQEFMLACNDYRGTPHYLTILEQEATAIIRRLKHHPCLALWCGGNELFNNWSCMTDQSLALRLLNKLCYEYDRERPFLMTSPIFGMGHGCYLFNYPDGREVFEVMPKASCTAYTEFGVPSVSNLECCRMIADEAKIFPLEKNDITVAHHAFNAWNPFEDAWCSMGSIRRYFGEPDSLEQLIHWSQWLQGEGYKCIFEEARRQKPYCSMAINWCYNEPWPTLANNSIINYPVSPKRSFYDVAASCRPQLASAQIPHFSWRAGEGFAADLWLLNDGMDVIPAGQVEVTLELMGKSYRLLRWDHDEVPANKNLQGPTVRFKLPGSSVIRTGAELNGDGVTHIKGSAHAMKLTLTAGDLSSDYTLLYYDDCLK